MRQRSLDPFESDLRRIFVGIVEPKIKELEYFYDEVGPLPTLQGANVKLKLGPKLFPIVKCLSKKGKVQVYQARDDDSCKFVCLKISNLPEYSLLWELYVANEIHSRIDEMYGKDYDKHQMLIEHKFGAMFEDAVCVETAYYGEGTLQDLVKLYAEEKEGIEEVLVMMYTLKLLSAIEVLHSVGIIHASLTPSNINQTTILSPKSYFDNCCLTLSGFADSIDLKLTPDLENVTFIGSNYTNGSACYCHEMRDGKPWKFQVDYQGAASIIHMLIYGSHMNTYYDQVANRWKICNSTLSGWDDKVWSNLFRKLINTGNQSENLLKEIREQLRASLDAHTTQEMLENALQRKQDLLFML